MRASTKPGAGQLWHWIGLTFAGCLTLLLLSFYATGDTDLQHLRNEGHDDLLVISQVIERDAQGNPTKVVVGASVLDNLKGSVVGDQVHVRIAGDVMWSRTKFQGASLIQGVVTGAAAPLLVALGLIFVGNLRYKRRPTSDLTWGSAAQPRPPKDLDGC